MAATESASARNGRHSRDDVAETALRILDEYGLPDLTMRRLAGALDVQPSALYWHFPNKQTLLAELADRIVARGRPEPRDGIDWVQRTRGEAVALRDALLAYRDGAEVVSSTFALGLGASAHLSRLTAAVETGGFDAATSRQAATALLHFILGHVSHEQQRMQYDSLGVLADGATPDALGGDSDGHGDGAGDGLGAGDGVGTGGQADSFAFGVTLLVEGLARHRVSAERVSRS